MSPSTRLSPSCQQIVQEDLSSIASTKLIIRSCMGDPLLRPTITNHKCNGVALNPGGLYLDMALTVAKYIWHHYRGPDAEEAGYNVHHLEIHKPLVIRDESKMNDLWLEMEVTPSELGSTSGDIMDANFICTFHGISPDGKRLQENGHCKVTFESYVEWLSSWSHHLPIIQDRIDALQTRAHKEVSGKVQLIQRSKAYELFQSFVDYGGNYQNMSEVIFDSETLEATARLTFLPHPSIDFCGPYYLDGSCHLSGFICNAVEKEKDKNAFISNGVGAMKLSPQFKPDRRGSEIRTYVRMLQQSNDRSILAGDVYVLQDSQIVGLWESVRFKKIPRRVLNVFLPPPKK